MATRHNTAIPDEPLRQSKGRARQHGNQRLFPDFDMLVFANKSIYNRVWMMKDLIKARPTSREMYSALVSTLVSAQTLVRPFGACTRVWTDTRVDTRPRTSLSVGLVYISRFISDRPTEKYTNHRFHGEQKPC